MLSVTKRAQIGTGSSYGAGGIDGWGHREAMGGAKNNQRLSEKGRGPFETDDLAAQAPLCRKVLQRWRRCVDSV